MGGSEAFLLCEFDHITSVGHFNLRQVCNSMMYVACNSMGGSMMRQICYRISLILALLLHAFAALPFLLLLCICPFCHLSCFCCALLWCSCRGTMQPEDRGSRTTGPEDHGTTGPARGRIRGTEFFGPKDKKNKRPARLRTLVSKPSVPRLVASSELLERFSAEVFALFSGEFKL